MRVFTDSRCAGHAAPPGFPERPERLERILAALRSDSRFDVVASDLPGDEKANAALLHTSLQKLL